MTPPINMRRAAPVRCVQQRRQGMRNQLHTYYPRYLIAGRPAPRRDATPEQPSTPIAVNAHAHAHIAGCVQARNVPSSEWLKP